MKKVFLSFVIVLSLVLFTNSCAVSSNSKVDDSNSSDISNNDFQQDSFVDAKSGSDKLDLTETLSQTTEDDGEYVEEINGFVELKSYSKRSSHCDACYDTIDDRYNKNNPFVFIWKNANESIPKIRRDSVVGITSPWENIYVIKINTDEARYMVPLNFWYYITDDEEEVEDMPHKLSDTIGLYSDNFEFDTGDLLSAGNPLEECNDQDLTEFVNDNSFAFFRNGKQFFRF